MGYPCNTGNKSFRCNGDLLRFYRDRKGMTQNQLACEAGYSVRLVGKAEAGQPIRMETVEVLAEALSCPEQTIGPIDLMTDPVALAKKYVSAQSLQREQFVAQVDNILSANFQLHVLADYNRLGLKNIYHGVGGLSEYYGRLYRSPNGFSGNAAGIQSQFFALGNEVLVWFQPDASVDLSGEFLFRSTTKLHFSGGMLVEQEDRISSQKSIA